MLIRETKERINKTEQDWEPGQVEIRYVGHHARTGAVTSLTLQGVKIGSCPERLPDDVRWMVRTERSTVAASTKISRHATHISETKKCRQQASYLAKR